MIEISGRVVLNLRVFYTGERPPEEDAFLDSLEPDKWYPLEHFLPVYRSYTKRYPEKARWQMKALGYLFRDRFLAMGVRTPQDALDHLPALYAETTRGDPGFAYRTLEKGPEHCLVEKDTWGDCHAALGTLEGTLQALGARRIQIEHVECKERGDARCTFDLRWSEPTSAPASNRAAVGEVGEATPRLLAMIGALQGVAAGQFEMEPLKEGDDVFGLLAVGINVMIRDVKELVEKEKELRGQLAHKVEELEATNEALREAQSQLVQREKMASLGQLVAGVAHELNTPIGVIYANVDLVRDLVQKLDAGAGSVRDKAREQLGRLLERCKEAALRTKTIVQDLRTFSRLHHAEIQTVDLHEGLESTLNLLACRQGEGIRFQREYGPIPAVECHAGQLHQVFMNLLQNACDAVAERGGGTVTVRTALRRAAELPDFGEELAPEQEVVVVQVEDDGVGIPAEVLPRIFDPFFTTKPVGSGTGLGLSISWQIVRRHGGRIRVESEPERGSTFHVEIPRRPLPAEGG